MEADARFTALRRSKGRIAALVMLALIRFMDELYINAYIKFEIFFANELQKSIIERNLLPLSVPREPQRPPAWKICHSF